MHKLSRPTTIPACLTATPAEASWSQFRANRKYRELVLALAEMQESFNSSGERLVRCAYCEIAIHAPNGNNPSVDDTKQSHVEHFRTQSSFPELRFQWENLFLSCLQYNLCGKSKDDGPDPYVPDDLIKPDHDDPAKFFRYTFSGTVEPQEGLSPMDAHRARTTISVLRLNDEPLNTKRETLLSEITKSFDDLASELGDDEILLKEYLSSEVRARSNEAFASAVIYNFGEYLGS